MEILLLASLTRFSHFPLLFPLFLNILKLKDYLKLIYAIGMNNVELKCILSPEDDSRKLNLFALLLLNVKFLHSCRFKNVNFNCA